MESKLCCNLPDRRVRLGWLSLQPDGSVSFGMSDNTYIAPRINDRIGIWNAYNRVRIEYEIPTDPSALEQVRNPHFTYHPSNATFHLKSNTDLKKNALFSVILPLDIAVAQEGEVSWVRAISSPLRMLRSRSGRRHSSIQVEEIAISASFADVSVAMQIDFVQHGEYRSPGARTWFYPHQGLVVRLTMFVVPAQAAILAWEHSF